MTLDNGPYSVVNDVIVDAGATLTIEPGVIVEVADNSSLIISGSLYAVGTADRPINFTTGRLNPSPGAWNTIRFAGGSDESFTLWHCTISYAVDAITIAKNGTQASVDIERCQISNNSGSGIMLVAMSEPIRNVLIKGNTIENNLNGIDTDGSMPLYDCTIIDNIILSNQQNGISVHNDRGYYYSQAKNVIISSNMIQSNNENGIYISQVASRYRDISDVTITSNIVSSNGANGIYLHCYGYGYDSYIYEINISSNKISTNGENGVYLESGAMAHSDIRDLIFSYNNVLDNGGHGIHLRSLGQQCSIHDTKFSFNNISGNKVDGIHLESVYSFGLLGNPLSQIYNISLSKNTITSNMASGAYAKGDNHNTQLAYDIEMSRNIIVANHQKGIWIDGGINGNISRNTITNSSCGIFYNMATLNLAMFNNIYYNTYGMNVSNGANVNAEYCYWGNPSGPYHPLLNPTGEGNPVNGNGTDLDFTPFLTIQIDHIPPVTCNNYDGSWHTKDFAINLTATDLSGVEETYYRINSGQTESLNVNGQPQIASEDANNILEYWSMDKAGNEELPHVILSGIKLDKDSPLTTITSPSPETRSSTVTAAWTSSDGTSGISRYEIRIDGGSWNNVGTNTTKTFAGLGDGNHIIDVKSLDKAGNMKQDTVNFVVNTSPLFGPGYAEEVAIAGTSIMVLTALVYLSRSRKFRLTSARGR